MAFFDRMTNESFRHAEGGTVYLPILKVGQARLLPTASDETAMRRIVASFYRYAVLIVCPIMVLGQFYLRLDGEVDLRDACTLAAMLAALLLPAGLLVAYLSRKFETLDVSGVEMNALAVGGGPSLIAALFLSAFTVCIGLLAFMALYGSAADYFKF